MLNRKAQRGALLLEVLVAVTVLSVGILACLRVFAGSLRVSNRSEEIGQVRQAIQQTYFPWFLNPVSFDPEKGNPATPGAADRRFPQSRFTFQKMGPEKTEGDDAPSGVIPPARPNTWHQSADFYDTQWEALGPKRNSILQLELYVMRYDKRKI